MKTSGTRNVIRWAAVGCAAVAATVALTGRQAARAADGDAPTTKPAAARDVKAIVADLTASRQQIAKAIGGGSSITDPAKRAAVADKAIPAFKKEIGYCDELAKANKQAAPQANALKAEATSMLYLFGDKPTVAEVDAMAASDDKVEQVKGKSIQVQSQWAAAGRDADAQSKAADAIEKLDAENPESIPLTVMTYQMSAGATPAVKERFAKIIADTMHNQAATQISQMMAAQAASTAKLAALAGKPLEVTGKTVDGKDFTSADYKGKVVLVDFWATWCGPCVAGLPEVKKEYADYHDQGLEIVGVSNDYTADALTKFTAKHDMPWVQLLDESAAGQHQWNPLTLGYGINGIPTMFLIDRKGICRTVEARSEMKDLIPKLLAEK